MMEPLQLDGLPLCFSPGLPIGFQGRKLWTGQASHVSGVWGSLVLQELETPGCLLRLFSVEARSNTWFRQNQKGEGVHVFFALEGTGEYSLQHPQSARLTPGYFVLWTGEQQEFPLCFKAEKPCCLGSLYFRAALVASFKERFPALWEKPMLFPPNPALLSAKPFHHSILDAVSNLFEPYFPAHLQPYYLDLTWQRVLFTLLVQASYKTAGAPPTRAEQEIAGAAYELVLKDIRKHILIEDIAYQLHCSPIWLKRAFRKVYGTGIFQLLRQSRMQKAKELLLEGENLKTVAFAIGMKPRNFPKEFRAYFGYTITALKKGGHG